MILQHFCFVCWKQCTNATADEVDAAVKAARKAFDAEGADSWAETTGKQRSKYLRALSDKIAANKPALSKLETLNCGKPLSEAEWALADVSGCFNYYAGLAEELDSKQAPASPGSDIKIADARFTIQMRYEPIGVAACVIPWNYPLLMLAWKVAPALAAGCTVVLKPSELTPLTAMQLAQYCIEIGLPAGVLNIITGTGAITGNALINHPQIDKIAFTGSVPTGLTVAMAGAKQLKPATLELGGKSPIIVFDDVDIEKAVEWIMFGCFWTNGQICSATSRLLVSESISGKLLPRLVAETQKIVIGNPNAPENAERTGMLGPVVSLGQHTKILGMIDQSVKEGGKVLTGGKKPSGKLYEGGYYIEPTIIQCGTGDVKQQKPNSIWTNEVFGPVLAVRIFSNEAEAVAMANDSEFGLAGAVLSTDLARAQRVVKRLRCGIAWINCSQPAFVEAPWGGQKKSGVGRELGPWGLNAYLQPKQITSYISQDPWAWYIKKDSKL